MKKFDFYNLRLSAADIFGMFFISLLLTCFLCQPARAQTPATTAKQQTTPAAPLNLDSDEAVKAAGQEPHSTDTKADVLSTAPDLFEQSILNSENRKKVFGMAEAGGSVGNMPAQHWHKSENIYCENAAVAVSDQISSTAQAGIVAQADSCHTR